MSSHCENIWHPSTFISSPLRTFDTRTHPWDIELEVVTIRARSLFTVHCHCSPCSSRSLFTVHCSLFTLHCCMRITHIVHFVHHVFWHTLGHPRALREMPPAYACVHATPTPHAQNTVHHHSVVFQRTCTQLPRHRLRRPGTKQKLTQHEFDNFCLTRWAVNVLGRHATRWTMNVLGNMMNNERARQHFLFFYLKKDAPLKSPPLPTALGVTHMHTFTIANICCFAQNQMKGHEYISPSPHGMLPLKCDRLMQMQATSSQLSSYLHQNRMKLTLDWCIDRLRQCAWCSGSW